MEKTEIRDSTINALLERSGSRNYKDYLAKILIKKVRGFVDEPVSFDFPVTAIIGPNGGGKTTVLGSAACAYKSITPRKYFAKSGKYDETMQDWVIEYEIIYRNINAKDSIRRTASFRNARWNRDAIDRTVLVFDVSRTVPANERSELLKCASSYFEVPPSSVKSFGPEAQKAIARILGKDISGFRELTVDHRGDIVLLTGATSAGASYSEFHFGAGESSIIRMITKIENAPDQTLILIEEIENGLHPVATVRLVEYLIEVSDRKRVQVIFTTHCNEALQPLPAKAVWVATRDRVFQGKLDVRSLRAITGQIETQGIVFVEDNFAKIWIEAILRQAADSPIDHVQVHAMSGDGTAVAMNKYHNSNPAIKTKSICIIDGDSKQLENDENMVFRLPGEMPESYVFDKVLEKWPEVGGRLAVAVLSRFEESNKVFEMSSSVRRQNMDAHLIFSEIGANLGLVPEQTIIAAFTNIWSQAYPDESAKIVGYINRLISN